MSLAHRHAALVSSAREGPFQVESREAGQGSGGQFESLGRTPPSPFSDSRCSRQHQLRGDPVSPFIVYAPLRPRVLLPGLLGQHYSMEGFRASEPHGDGRSFPYKEIRSPALEVLVLREKLEINF